MVDEEGDEPLERVDVDAAVRVAPRHVDRAAGGELGAVRLDSGDLVALAFKVRGQLDSRGATSTKITVTNDLDEYAIAALGAAPIDSYGVGTRLVTGSGVPTAALVYKMVEREDAEGTMRGAIQVPPDGFPIILGPDHPVTGAYPVIGVVVEDDIDMLAQVRPGQTVRMHWSRPRHHPTGLRSW